MSNQQDSDSIQPLLNNYSTENTYQEEQLLEQYQNLDMQNNDQYLNQDSTYSTTESDTLQQHPEFVKGKLTPFAAVFSLVNSVVGVGLLSTPYIFKAGYIVSPIIQLVFAFTSILSYYQLIVASNQSHRHDYLSIGRNIMPGYVGIINVVMQIVAVYGAVISYNIVLKDNMFFFDDSDLYKDLLLSAIVLIIIMPLSMLPSLDKLKFSSYLVLICVAYVAFALIYQFCIEAKDDTLPSVKPADGPSTLQSISLTVGAYSGQYQFLNIYKETDNKRKHGKNVVNIGNGVLFLIYLIVGLFGYLCYGEDTKADILCNLADNKDSIIANIGNISMILLLCCHMPLPVYAIRETLLQNTKYKYSVTARCLTAAGICIIAMILGMVLPSVDCILDFTNSIAGNYLASFYPGLHGFVLARILKDKKNQIFGMYLMIFGCAACIFGLYSATLKWIVPLF